MVSLRDLTVRYPAFQLGPLTLDVRTGERVAIVGANGAGKSTLLRALAGRLPAYDGSMRVCGAEVREHRTQTRGGVGLLPEAPPGLPWMTVREHLAFVSGFYATWDLSHEQALSESLQVPRDKPLAHLSRGNRAKLGLVAAEAHRPRLVLLDEPTSGIDPVMRHQLLRTVDGCLAAESGRTLLFSTHILEDVEPLAARVLLLKEGRLIGDHPLDELREEHPRTPLTTVLTCRLAGA